MPYLCIWEHLKLPISMVTIADRAPTKPDKDGFEAHVILPIDPGKEAGAALSIGEMDKRLHDVCKARGVYQTDFERVCQVFMDIVNEVPKPPPEYGLIERVMAGAAAVLLAGAMGALIPWATLVWLIVCAFKTQTGLTTMAETAVVWSIFDWRPTIRRLAKIARSK